APAQSPCPDGSELGALREARCGLAARAMGRDLVIEPDGASDEVVARWLREAGLPEDGRVGPEVAGEGRAVAGVLYLLRPYDDARECVVAAKRGQTME
ncbi:MAG: hypothetical protein R3A52_13585, partial [Polyangiales bacterium]